MNEIKTEYEKKKSFFGIKSNKEGSKICEPISKKWAKSSCVKKIKRNYYEHAI